MRSVNSAMASRYDLDSAMVLKPLRCHSAMALLTDFDVIVPWHHLDIVGLSSATENIKSLYNNKSDFLHGTSGIQI